MPELDVSTLDSIFRMMTPADLLGAQKLSVGGKSSDIPFLRQLLNIIYGDSGAQNVEQMCTLLEDFQKKVGDDDVTKDQFKRILHFYKTGAPCTAFGEAPFMAVDNDGKTIINNVTFDQIVGPKVDLEAKNKSMGIIMCNSGFMSPAVRNAERVEMFMNFMPSIVASRMVPLLEVEFEFNRTVADAKTSQPHMWSPGLMKFLLGGDQSSLQDDASPSKMMLDLRETKDDQFLHSIAGMEMFTSPQTLLNISPAANAGRYVDVLDPFRPFMTIENFSVNVTPTVGLYSYKKASLVFKLHDRSRLNEIADLIRPQVYQDRGSAPTVWITYGWRHPDEPGNPYADFINGNMLVREAYGVINSQFSFDQVGQVTITVNLWTKGLSELKTLKINDDGSLRVVHELEEIAKAVAKYRNSLGIGTREGTNVEIRGSMLLDSAERGTFPDMTTDEITKAVTSLKNSLKSQNAKLDTEAVDALVKQLDKFYSATDKKHLDFKKELENQATEVTKKQFKEVIQGADPFLPIAKKDEKKKTESKTEPHPFTSIIEALNSYVSETEVNNVSTALDKTSTFQKKAASFGKLFTVFTANFLKQIDSVDEMQLFFYQFNDKAGAAAGANIAEFPIEMPIFLDQYRDHVERKRSERVTLEEFLQLAIDAQLHDTRAIGYGFKKFYAKYDPANKHDVKLASGINPDYAELSHREFRMPVISVYVETVYAAESGVETDKLREFEVAKFLEGGNKGDHGRAKHYKRIMRIHVFDKNNNPYKLADSLLQDDNKLTYVETSSAFLKQLVNDKKTDAANFVSSIIPTLTADATLNREKDGSVSNQQIKNFVSKMVPTIVYGGNASSVIAASLSSKQDALLATTQMQQQSKQGRPQTLQANGSDTGGLPLRVIPASMTLTTLGCPLLTYAQMFFIDFNTGTTIDNIYGITGLTHTLSPGKFESQLTLTYADAYGKFVGAPTITEYFTSMQVPEKK